MWTSYPGGLVPQRKAHNESKEMITFPPISKGLLANISRRNSRNSQLADYHWNGTYRRVTREMATNIKQHLKQHFLQRHVKKDQFCHSGLYTDDEDKVHSRSGDVSMLKSSGPLKRSNSSCGDENSQDQIKGTFYPGDPYTLEEEYDGDLNFTTELTSRQGTGNVGWESMRLRKKDVRGSLSSEVFSDDISNVYKLSDSLSSSCFSLQRVFYQPQTLPVMSVDVKNEAPDIGKSRKDLHYSTRDNTTSTVQAVLSKNVNKTGELVWKKQTSTERENAIIHGNIRMPYTSEKKMFMVYLCGGYKDTEPERTALLQKAYPQLYTYCKERGYNFRLCDLRWGVRDGVNNNNNMLTLHLETLRQCLETEGPNFFLITGQKQDSPAIPETIQQEAFEKIVNTIERMKPESTKKKNVLLNHGTEETAVSMKLTVSKHLADDSRENFTMKSEDKENDFPGSESFTNTDVDFTDASIQTKKLATDYQKEIDCLHQWYKLDENCIPSVYRLQPISSLYRDIYSRDPARRQQAKTNWLSVSQKLYNIFQDYAPLAVNGEVVSELLRTAVAQETEYALNTYCSANDHCYWFKRTITDLKYNLANEKASDYIDILALRPEINEKLQKAHQNFIAHVHSKLHHTNILEYGVSWGNDGINPGTNRSHTYYIERLCSDFQTIITNQYNKIISSKDVKDIPDIRWRKDMLKNRVKEEILEHAQHCQKLVTHFMGKEDFLLALRNAVLFKSGKMIWVQGDAGYGKSSVMAKAALSAVDWIPGDLRVVVRFTGITGDSKNVRLLLYSLCYQIAEIYNISIDLSEDYGGLLNQFTSLLEYAGEDKPLMICLDALDELSEDYDASISWIPAELPHNVYIIVSSSILSDKPCSKALQKLTNQQNILEIPPLTSEETEKMIDYWLERNCRRLNSNQKHLLLEACRACPAPLFLKCAFSESCGWTSFSSSTETHLPETLFNMYSWLFNRLEKDHGEYIVKRVTILITVSRNGITLEELLDLLSLDETVIQEVQRSQKLSVTRFPLLLWIRFQKDLGIHLVEQRTDNTYVYNWAHSSFREFCIGKYLKSKDLQFSVHAVMADYFLGKRIPPGVRSPNAYDTAEHIAMPLAWVVKKNLKVSYTFNYRKLHGISYHLIKSNQAATLTNECCFNYEFLLHKAWALSILDTEQDLKAAMSSERQIPDLNLLYEAIRLSKPVLLKDPCQLASQLIGRLHQIVAADTPVAPGDPKKYSYLPTLLSQCFQSSVHVVVPSFTCLLPPGGLSYDMLTGHTDAITAVSGFQKDLTIVTASKDGTLKLWDLTSGRTTFTLRDVGKNINSITVCKENKMVAVTENNCLKVLDIYSGRIVYTASGSLDSPILTTALDGQLLLAFYDGSHSVKVFDLAKSCKLLHHVDLSPGDNPIHKDHSIVVSQNSLRDYVLFAYRSGQDAMVFSATKGEVIAKLTANEPVASVQAVDVAKDYLLVICRYPYLGQKEIVHIELFSAQNFVYIRTVKGCSNDPISTISINHLASHVVALCTSPETNTTEIVTWNLETEDHKHMAKFPSMAIAGVCSDLRYCLTVCEGENYLREWNLVSRINEQTFSVHVNNLKKADGIEEILHMKNYPRYAVCRSMAPGIVTVWNIVKSKCKGSAVRVERGLIENTDIVLIKDMKLYILTDRAMATFTETPRPIYQTLLTYDLLRKKYIKKQTGLYIIPCPRHEYKILDGGLLLGLSENRDHFVIWNLETGFIKDRIRAVYKEKPLQTDMLSADLLTNDSVIYKELESKWKNGEDGSAPLTPWERRNETKTARKRRLASEVKKEVEKLQGFANEKNNAVDQYLMSGDEKVIVSSHYAHHLAVFNLETLSHVHTLEDETSMLFLHNASLTHTGSFLLLPNYNDDKKISYVTLWDLESGKVRKRLKNEPNVCCTAITDDADRVVFGVMKQNRIKVWDPFKRGHKTIPGYENLHITVGSKLCMLEGGAKAVLLAGDVSLWDLISGTVLSVFTPDSKIRCLSLTPDGYTVLIGMSDNSALISLKLTSQDGVRINLEGTNMFGEQSSSSEDEEETEDQDPTQTV
ncbi:NACHT and WD repeat domain-containing protein 2-like [Protopterus annectens]|uniref:NACHT and WD repeat domain-containing protein 2-like n=1 Tax=Protopterus annectens TaxID=7888 RepID=UPI001CF94607|nr:NACHT and WD repeat domain-containing protein 2-like [Protopterus annectens]